MWQRFLQWLSPSTLVRPADLRAAGEDAAAAKAAAGAAGEQAAADFLCAQGWHIVARNWRSPRDRRDELDLVGRDGDVLVFVEVKTRAATALVAGYDTVNARKKRVLRRAATAYLRGLRPPPATFRLDVVEVATHADGRPPDVRHFENVPLFPKHFLP
ncbi:MAG: YraN family protein [Verrucomicrobiota bacterium]